LGRPPLNNGHLILSGAIATAILFAAAPVQADRGEGAYPRRRGDAVRAFGPLERLGDNAVRFSSAPALGGRGVVVELAGQPDGTAKGGVTFVHGHPYQGWKQADRLPLVLGVPSGQGCVPRYSKRWPSRNPHPGTVTIWSFARTVRDTSRNGGSTAKAIG